MAPWVRALAYTSPLTYARDLMNHAVLGSGYLNRWLDLALLPFLMVGFFILATRMHRRCRVGYCQVSTVETTTSTAGIKPRRVFLLGPSARRTKSEAQGVFRAQ